jgi:mercuric ion transport protein
MTIWPAGPSLSKTIDMDQRSVVISSRADSPDLPAFRRLLRTVMKARGLVPVWKESYVMSGASVSIDGTVAWKNRQADFSGLSSERLTQLFEESHSRMLFSWKRMISTHLSFLWAVLVAFFPKCPFCWAAYMSLFSSWGIGRLPYQPWLLPVLIILMFVNVVSLYFSRVRHGYLPLVMSLTGGIFIMLQRIFLFEQHTLLYAGAALMIIASLWNSLSRRIARSVGLYLRRPMMNS